MLRGPLKTMLARGSLITHPCTKELINLHFLAIPFKPQTLEDQSRALKTQIFT